jgi:hypothetical protein
VTARDGGNADNAWNNYLPTTFYFLSRKGAEKTRIISINNLKPGRIQIKDYSFNLLPLAALRSYYEL